MAETEAATEAQAQAEGAARAEAERQAAAHAAAQAAAEAERHAAAQVEAQERAAADRRAAAQAEAKRAAVLAEAEAAAQAQATARALAQRQAEADAAAAQDAAQALAAAQRQADETVAVSEQKPEIIPVGQNDTAALEPAAADVSSLRESAPDSMLLPPSGHVDAGTALDVGSVLVAQQVPDAILTSALSTLESISSMQVRACCRVTVIVRVDNCKIIRTRIRCNFHLKRCMCRVPSRPLGLFVCAKRPHLTCLRTYTHPQTRLVLPSGPARCGGPRTGRSHRAKAARAGGSTEEEGAGPWRPGACERRAQGADS